MERSHPARRSVTMVLAMAMVLLLLMVPHMGSIGGAEGYDTFFIRTFEEGASRSDLAFPAAGVQETGIEVPMGAEIFNASVNASSAAYTSGALNYPTDPYLDLGGDGAVDWRYSGLGYGRWGLQNVFNDNSSQVNLTFQENDTREVRFKLPRDAEVIGGGFTTGGWPVPYWGPEYVVSNTSTQSKGEHGPVLEVFGDRMYEAWESKDPSITDGSDFDIVYRWFDGDKWSEPIQLSPLNDYLEDDSPNLLVFKDRLYCVWSASESEDFFANDDIYMRSTEDGRTWSAIRKVSPVVRAGMNDWPLMEIFKDRIYIFWKTMDDSIADVTSENDMDIVYRWFDGDNFGPIHELTKNDDGAIDWSYDITVYNNRLYIALETDVGDWLTYQVDIKVRSFDGYSWSEWKNLCPSNDDTKDEIPRMYVWYNSVTGINELYVIWGRGDGEPDGSGDIDIVIRMFDGSGWSDRQEISKPDVTVQNMGHQLIGYEGRLYAIWIDGKDSVIVGEDKNLIVFKIFGDIVIRSYDGYEWSNIKELTPYGQTDSASDPELCVFNGKLYATWSYPNDASSESQDWDIIIRNIDFRDVTLEVDIGKDGTADWDGELTSSQQYIPLNKSQIEEAMVGGSIEDSYGNEITEVAISITSRYPAKITVHNLRIEYRHELSFTFTDQLDGFVDVSNGTDDRDEGDARFPIEGGSSSEGRIVLDDLEVEYLVNYAPYLVREIPVLYMNEDEDWENAVDLEEHFDDDWDDGRLRFRIESLESPSHLDAHLRGSELDFRTPTENWYGTSNVTVVAVDGFGLLSHPYTLTVRVLPVNDRPILEFIPDQNLKAGEGFKYNARAFDVDGDDLTFADDTERFDIDPESGKIRFIPGQRGEFSVNISVSDGFGGSDHQNVTFIVEGETTSSSDTSCFSLVAIVLLAVAIGLLVLKLRHEFKWGPVAPERVKLVSGEEDDDEEEDRGFLGGVRSRARALIPGTDVTYDRYDTNEDGFLDEEEWDRAVEEIKERRQKHLADLKSRAKRMAREDLDLEVDPDRLEVEGVTDVPIDEDDGLDDWERMDGDPVGEPDLLEGDVEPGSGTEDGSEDIEALGSELMSPDEGTGERSWVEDGPAPGPGESDTDLGEEGGEDDGDEYVPPGMK